MLEKTSQADTEEGQDKDLATTVLTCEGDLHDPTFPGRLQSLVLRLRELISDEEQPFWVRKVEPWNSVRVTFTIPREAAARLRQLAERGDSALRELGILSVQIEGDQVISLTLAGRYGEPPQEIILQKAEEPSTSSGAGPSTARPVPGPSGRGPQPTIPAAAGAATPSGSCAFRSPNVVAPPSREPLPFLPGGTSRFVRPAARVRAPFPFASMTHAMNTKQGATRFPFASPPFAAAQRVPPGDPRGNVALSSPLLVNLLQSETGRGTPEQKRQRRLQRNASAGKAQEPNASPSPPPDVPAALGGRAFVLPDVPLSPPRSEATSAQPSPPRMTEPRPTKHLINPFTGHLEPMPSDEEEEETAAPPFPENGRPCSEGKDGPPSSDTDSGIGKSHTDGSQSSTEQDVVREEDVKPPPVEGGEKLKLRLKLDSKRARGEPPPSPPAEPRVPPLHISLRGPNAAVVVSPRREEATRQTDGAPRKRMPKGARGSEESRRGCRTARAREKASERTRELSLMSGGGIVRVPVSMSPTVLLTPLHLMPSRRVQGGDGRSAASSEEAESPKPAEGSSPVRTQSTKESVQSTCRHLPGSSEGNAPLRGGQDSGTPKEATPPRVPNHEDAAASPPPGKEDLPPSAFGSTQVRPVPRRLPGGSPVVVEANGVPHWDREEGHESPRSCSPIPSAIGAVVPTRRPQSVLSKRTAMVSEAVASKLGIMGTNHVVPALVGGSRRHASLLKPGVVRVNRLRFGVFPEGKVNGVLPPQSEECDTTVAGLEAVVGSSECKGGGTALLRNGTDEGPAESTVSCSATVVVSSTTSQSLAEMSFGSSPLQELSSESAPESRSPAAVHENGQPRQNGEDRKGDDGAQNCGEEEMNEEQQKKSEEEKEEERCKVSRAETSRPTIAGPTNSPAASHGGGNGEVTPPSNDGTSLPEPPRDPEVPPPETSSPSTSSSSSPSSSSQQQAEQATPEKECISSSLVQESPAPSVPSSSSLLLWSGSNPPVEGVRTVLGDCAGATWTRVAPLLLQADSTGTAAAPQVVSPTKWTNSAGDAQRVTLIFKSNLPGNGAPSPRSLLASAGGAAVPKAVPIKLLGLPTSLAELVSAPGPSVDPASSPPLRLVVSKTANSVAGPVNVATAVVVKSVVVTSQCRPATEPASRDVEQRTERVEEKQTETVANHVAKEEEADECSSRKRLKREDERTVNDERENRESSEITEGDQSVERTAPITEVAGTVDTTEAVALSLRESEQEEVESVGTESPEAESTTEAERPPESQEKRNERASPAGRLPAASDHSSEEEMSLSELAHKSRRAVARGGGPVGRPSLGPLPLGRQQGKENEERSPRPRRTPGGDGKVRRLLPPPVSSEEASKPRTERSRRSPANTRDHRSPPRTVSQRSCRREAEATSGDEEATVKRKTRASAPTLPAEPQDAVSASKRRRYSKDSHR